MGFINNITSSSSQYEPASGFVLAEDRRYLKHKSHLTYYKIYNTICQTIVWENDGN